MQPIPEQNLTFCIAKPCEIEDNYDCNCLNCESFNDCQMIKIVDIKSELKVYIEQ